MSETKAVTVLVVDDDPLVRKSLGKLVRGVGYEAVLVEDATQALRRLDAPTPPIDLALIDVNLPGMDGISLTRRLRTRPPDAYVPVILVTSDASPSQIERGLDAGADDYVTKPFDARELEARMRNVIRIRTMEEELRARHQTMKQDLEAARQLQFTFIPCSPLVFEPVKFAWLYEPSHYTSGDMLNIFRLDESRYALYVADISGHGVSAAMLSIWLNRTLHPTPEEGAGVTTPHPPARGFPLGAVPGQDPIAAALADPPEVCSLLERRFAGAGTRKFIALLYAVYDSRTRELTFSRCALPYPLRLPRSGDIAPLQQGGNPPIGLGLGSRFTAHTVNLQPGDRVFFYSDGFIDASSDENEHFGETRLAAEIARHRDAPVEMQIQETHRLLREFQEGRDPDDDLTLLAMEVLE